MTGSTSKVYPHRGQKEHDAEASVKFWPPPRVEGPRTYAAPGDLGCREGLRLPPNQCVTKGLKQPIKGLQLP